MLIVRILFKNILIQHVYVYMPTHGTHGACMKVKRLLMGIMSILLPCGFQECSSGDLAWQQSPLPPLPTELSSGQCWNSASQLIGELSASLWDEAPFPLCLHSFSFVSCLVYALCISPLAVFRLPRNTLHRVWLCKPFSL